LYWYLSLSFSRRLAALPLKMPARYSTLPLPSSPQSLHADVAAAAELAGRAGRGPRTPACFDEVSSCRPSGTLNCPAATWNRPFFEGIPVQDEVLERAGVLAPGSGPASQLQARRSARGDTTQPVKLGLGAADAEGALGHAGPAVPGSWNGASGISLSAELSAV